MAKSRTDRVPCLLYLYGISTKKRSHISLSRDWDYHAGLHGRLLEAELLHVHSFRVCGANAGAGRISTGAGHGWTAVFETQISLPSIISTTLWFLCPSPLPTTGAKSWVDFFFFSHGFSSPFHRSIPIASTVFDQRWGRCLYCRSGIFFLFLSSFSFYCAEEKGKKGKGRGNLVCLLSYVEMGMGLMGGHPCVNRMKKPVGCA